MIRSLLLTAALAAACACGRSSSKDAAAPATNDQTTWSAYRGETEVLRFKKGSGPLRSTAMLPPGASPTIHPFLTATALQSMEEDTLRGALDGAKNFDEFVAGLKKAGYDLRPAQTPL